MECRPGRRPGTGLPRPAAPPLRGHTARPDPCSRVDDRRRAKDSRLFEWRAEDQIVQVNVGATDAAAWRERGMVRKRITNDGKALVVVERGAEVASIVVADVE